MSQVASAISQKETHKSMLWRYSLTGDRDLRIDFMRGIALVMMVVAGIRRMPSLLRGAAKNLTKFLSHPVVVTT